MFTRLVTAVKNYLLQSQSVRRENALRNVLREMNLTCSEECPNCNKPEKTYLILKSICSSCDHQVDLVED